MVSGSGQGSEFTPQSPWLDLVNSEMWDGFGRYTDHLAERRWVRAFLARWKLTGEDLDPTDAARQLGALRRFLRRSAETLAATGALPKSAIAKLNGYLSSQGRLQLSMKDGEPHTEFVPVRRDWRWVEGQICLSFADALATPERIKICPNAGCNWAFYDRTKANIRKWCNDRACSNRDRVRRARARSG